MKNILTLSYRIYLGNKGERFITESFEALKRVTKSDELATIHKIFAKRRKAFKELGLPENLRGYKEGSLLRSIKIAGKNNFCGTVVDVGANDNRLGKILLRTCCDISAVIGVDIENRNAYTDSDRLKFIKQDDPCKLPLESTVADVVIMRFSLHHMDLEAQNNILSEANRVLRKGGKIIVFEDSHSQTLPPIVNNDVHARFMKLDDESKYMITLSFLDASSCFVFEETMPFCFSFRKLEDWEAQLKTFGFKKISIDYWGIPFFSLFQAPLGIMVYEKI